MQKFLSKYAVAAHLALLAVSPLFLFPFFPADVIAEVMFWLVGFAAVWVFLEPSRHADEMLHDARSRVVSAVLHDPLFWVMAVLTLLAALRWINSTVEMAFDVEQMRWYLREPVMVALPGAAVGRGKYEFAVTLATAIVLIGVRHSLGKQARLSFVFSASSFAGIAAMIAISAAVLGNAEAFKAANASFREPSFVGAVFGAYALASVIALAGAIEVKWRKVAWIPALSIGGTFAGAFLFSPSVAVLLYGAVAAVTAFLCLVWLGAVSRGVNAMKFFAIMFIGLAIAVVLLTCAAPDEIVASRVARIKTFAFFPDKFEEIRAVLAKASLKTWEGAKWLGTGLGTFSSQLRFIVDKADWKVLLYARPCAYSAWWTLLAERGLVGAIMLAVPLGFLFFSFFRRLPGVFFGRSFFLPGCWLGFAVFGMAVAESFCDVSFLRPEAMLAVAVFLAISAGSLPPLKKKTTSTEDAD